MREENYDEEDEKEEEFTTALIRAGLKKWTIPLGGNKNGKTTFFQ